MNVAERARLLRVVEEELEVLALAFVASQELPEVLGEWERDRVRETAHYVVDVVERVMEDERLWEEAVR